MVLYICVGCPGWGLEIEKAQTGDFTEERHGIGDVKNRILHHRDDWG